jgi:hypothetical protein
VGLLAVSSWREASSVDPYIFFSILIQYYAYFSSHFRVSVMYLSLIESPFVALISHRCQSKPPMVIAYWTLSPSSAFSDEYHFSLLFNLNSCLDFFVDDRNWFYQLF